jgi:hypothetical protein
MVMADASQINKWDVILTIRAYSHWRFDFYQPEDTGVFSFLGDSKSPVLRRQ